MMTRLYPITITARRAAPAAALCSALLAGGCGLPGASKDPSVAELPRTLYDVPAVDGIRVSAVTAGEPGAPRLIYVHGTPGDATNFAAFLTDPVPGFESVSIDRPGFAQSESDGAVTSLAAQAAAIEPLLIQHRGEWPILVGHSLGGPVVARAAADYPDRVRAIVIVAGALDPDLEKVLFIQRVGDFAFVPWLLPRWARHANRELLALEDELRALEPLLAEIRCPVVIVHGTDDRLVPYANVAFMQDRFARSHVETITIDEGDHFLLWNAQDTIRDAIGRAQAAP